MIKDFNSINWHDSKILAVTEDCENDMVTIFMDLDVSSACDGTSYAEKIVIFSDTSRFSVDEGPVFGFPVVLEAIMTEEVMDGRPAYRVVFETNAGRRNLYCSRFLIRDSAQQDDAPEPATMIFSAWQHRIGRPGDP